MKLKEPDLKNTDFPYIQIYKSIINSLNFNWQAKELINPNYGYQTADH